MPVNCSDYARVLNMLRYCFNNILVQCHISIPPENVRKPLVLPPEKVRKPLVLPPEKVRKPEGQKGFLTFSGGIEM